MAKEEDTDQEEPSIEEILDSIRQIISDDDDEEGAGDEAAADPEPVAKAPEPEIPEEVVAEPEPEPEPEDIIELTEKVEEAAPEPEYEPEEDVEEAPIEVDMMDTEPEAAPEPVVEEPEPEPEPIAKPAPASDDGLLTEKAEDAALSAFSTLAQKAAVNRSGGVTVEEIVRDELRPLLRQWIDKHLPSIVERLLQDELDRVAKRAREE